MPYRRNEIPPITGPGIVWIIIDNFPTNEHIIDNIAAPPITRTLYTFVTAITPIFSPYVVVGTDPIRPDTIVEKLSPNKDLWSPGSVRRSLPMILLVTTWCPICSDVITRSTGKIIKIAPISNFGAWKFGIANHEASTTCVKSRIPQASAVRYPAITAIKIGITDKNPLNKIFPNTATPNVTANTITFFGSILSSKSPALLAAEPDNSRPINATTGPIAAGGSTISIHFVPHL